ncbi:MAG: flavin reductase family protein [Candidatus Thorarchaeota archaeon]
MSKIELKSRVSPYPMPVIIAGTIIDNRPNFMAVAWFNRLNGTPPLWGMSIGKKQYTLEGIRANGNFSINVPSADLVTETDYVGIVSGRDADKSSIFNVFYGKMETAPMIRECPLTMECTVHDIIELPSSVLVLGDPITAYTEERFMTDGKLDPMKIDPFMLTQPDNHYWRLGEIVADAFAVGKKLSK